MVFYQIDNFTNSSFLIESALNLICFFLFPVFPFFFALLFLQTYPFTSDKACWLKLTELGLFQLSLMLTIKSKKRYMNRWRGKYHKGF